MNKFYLNCYNIIFYEDEHNYRKILYDLEAKEIIFSTIVDTGLTRIVIYDGNQPVRNFASIFLRFVYFHTMFAYLMVDFMDRRYCKESLKLSHNYFLIKNENFTPHLFAILND